MPKNTYAILHNPGHNRVYFETSRALSMAEFAIAAQNLAAGCTNVRRENIEGIDYVLFDTERAMTEADIRVVSELSFVYALYQVSELGSELVLKPIRKVCAEFVDEGIGAILKYTGKTNEIFTRMMINIAYYSQGSRENIRLLDPIAGKGTTLYEGLVKGYHVHGIEIGDTVVNEAVQFVKRFLEMARYKFTYAPLKISGPNKMFTAQRHTFEAARTKEAAKAGDTRKIGLIAGNSVYADRYYPKKYFDIIVGDLPYGVQHGNVTSEKQSSLTRNPAELLGACLPAWATVLKQGGALALAWNSNVLPRERMEVLLAANGFAVQKEEPYLQLAHRVDQAIMRDVVVAKKLPQPK